MSRPTTPMTWALVCGDGLPVSGLLTVFRNVLDIAADDGLVRLPLAADLGYSWRPDKSSFFPHGPTDDHHPPWLRVSREVPGEPDPQLRAAELDGIRGAVARADDLSDSQRESLRWRVDAAAAPYEEYFTRWFAEEDPDWVIAVNMTLSDGVPATTGLHRAAARRWTGTGRTGGVLFWDHDLFGSCAIESGGERLYPSVPHELTPVPQPGQAHRWVVASEALAAEAATYPTALGAEIAPNVLPSLDRGLARDRHRSFAQSRGIDPARPVVLAPMRLFRVKGVEISIAAFAGTAAACRDQGLAEPALLIFGSRAEEPDYTAEVDELVAELGLADSVRFLDGVPLSSRSDINGYWHLNETDLLVLARESGGAVMFTPSTPDVETVGLGPALAACAGIPCAVTPYDAFADTFGPDFRVVTVDPHQPHAAGRELATLMHRRRVEDPGAVAELRRNREIVSLRFDSGPWRRILAEMAQARTASPLEESA